MCLHQTRSPVHDALLKWLEIVPGVFGGKAWMLNECLIVSQGSLRTLPEEAQCLAFSHKSALCQLDKGASLVPLARQEAAAGWPRGRAMTHPLRGCPASWVGYSQPDPWGKGMVNPLGFPYKFHWRGVKKYTFLFLLTPFLLGGYMSSCQYLQNKRACGYQFRSLIALENLQDGTSFLIESLIMGVSLGGKGAFIWGPNRGLSAEVCDTEVCAFWTKTDWLSFPGTFTHTEQSQCLRWGQCGGATGTEIVIDAQRVSTVRKRAIHF